MLLSLLSPLSALSSAPAFLASPSLRTKRTGRSTKCARATKCIGRLVCPGIMKRCVPWMPIARNGEDSAGRKPRGDCSSNGTSSGKDNPSRPGLHPLLLLKAQEVGLGNQHDLQGQVVPSLTPTHQPGLPARCSMTSCAAGVVGDRLLLICRPALTAPPCRLPRRSRSTKMSRKIAQEQRWLPLLFSYELSMEVHRP
jgi:hypothetical protein